MKRNVLFIIVSAVMVLTVISGFFSRAPAENVSDKPAEARLIGFIFKVLAKGVVVASEPDNLKTKVIDKINRMREEDFRSRYQDFYEHFLNNRVSTDRYGFYDNMTRPEAVKFIRSLNKDKMFVLIDLLPDDFIANEFKRYLFKNKEAAPGPDNTTALWDRVNKMIACLKAKYM